MGIGTSAVSMVGGVLRAGKNIPTSGKAAGLGFGLDMGFNLAGGDNLGTATIKAGVTGVMTATNPLLFTTLTLGSLGVEGSIGYQKWKYQKQQWWNSKYAYNNTVGGGYVDTQRAQTMRQAAVQAIQGSKMNARSALGGEAKIMNPYASRRY